MRYETRPVDVQNRDPRPVVFRPTRYSYLERPQRCPACGCRQSDVLSTPRVAGSILRLRRCAGCGKGWKSTETVIEGPQQNPASICSATLHV